MSKFQHDVMLRIVKILNVLMIELPFAACWFLYIPRPMQIWHRRSFCDLGLFFILYIALDRKSYDAFWMSKSSGSQSLCMARSRAMAT